MDGADDGFAIVGGNRKVRCKRQLGMHDVYFGGFFDTLEFTVAVTCENEGFDGGHFGAFEERDVELWVYLDVLGLVAAGYNVDVVAVLDEFVAEVVDVAACTACQGPVFG